jgi:sugar phosphate isomerase/epimerase
MADLNRRSFLGLAGSTAMASAFSKALAAAPGSYPPGIQLYAVRDPLATDAPRTLRKLHEIGYLEVETAGFGKYTAKDYRGFCDDVNLKIPSAHLGFQDATDFGPLFADANTLGAQYATSSVLFTRVTQPSAGPAKPTAPTAPPPIGLDGFKKIAARMNDIGTKAKAAGLQYAYHNHNHEFEKMPDGSYGYDVLLRETDPRLVKFEIDCGWMVMGGADPVHYFKQYPGRFRMLHVKDFKIRTVTTLRVGPARPQGTELGHGFIDYHPIFAAAHTAGIEHAFAEQEGPYVRPQLESAEVSYEYLRSLA